MLSQGLNYLFLCWGSCLWLAAILCVLQGMKTGLHLIHLSRKLIGIIYNLMKSNIAYELEECIPVLIPTLSSCVSLSMPFNSEPWFLQASSTDPKNASFLGPLSRWDQIGEEDAWHSASSPPLHLAGEIHFCALQGHLGSCCHSQATW